jgi:hypothetical protein
MYISSAKKALLSERAILYLQAGNITFIESVCKKAPEKNKKIQKNLFKDRKKDILKVCKKVGSNPTGPAIYVPVVELADTPD